MFHVVGAARGTAVADAKVHIFTNGKTNIQMFFFTYLLKVRLTFECFFTYLLNVKTNTGMIFSHTYEM